MAAGSCARPGAAGVFTDAGGTWRSAGLTLPGTVDRVRVLGLTALAGGNAALLAVSLPGGNSLLAAWWDGTRWTVSAPVTADGVRALGFGPGGSAWLLPGGGRAETIAGTAGSAWRALPPVPPGTGTLAPGPADPTTRWPWPGPGSPSGGSPRGPGPRSSRSPCRSSTAPRVRSAMTYLTGHWSFDPFLILALGRGRLARDRAVAAGPPVPAGADPAAAAAVAVVLRRAGRAAARGGVAGRLLGRRLLLRAHDPAPAADVRRAVADRRGRAVAAAAGRAARPVRAERDPRRAGRRLVAGRCAGSAACCCGPGSRWACSTRR